MNTIPLVSGHALAERRRQGAKLVVVDPFCSNAAAKADEWLPLKPGTDGALALAMLNIMVYELGIYDVDFLKHQTNGPYLVQPDGHYLRDEESGGPLVWDLSDGRAKPYDADDLKDSAIEGNFEVAEGSYRPAFHVLKDHLGQIDVDEMSRICTIPIERIRRITKEFCEAARIGSTIEIEGHKLPLRPAGIDFKRGAAAHKGGFNTCFGAQKQARMGSSCPLMLLRNTISPTQAGKPRFQSIWTYRSFSRQLCLLEGYTPGESIIRKCLEFLTSRKSCFTPVQI